LNRTNEIELDRLVHRVRRRLIWKARLARMMRCQTAACAAAVVLSLILLGFGRPTVLAPAGVLAAGIVIGIVGAAGARVSPMAAAAWADQRAGLNDLLATAWAIRLAPGSDAAWNCAIVEMAESRARRIKAGELTVVMGGGRAWSALALGAALALTIGMISPSRNGAANAASAARVTDGQSGETVWTSSPVRDRPAGDAALNEPTNRTASGDVAADDGADASRGDGRDRDSTASGNHSSAGRGLAVTSAAQARPDSLALSLSSIAAAHGTIAGGAAGIAPAPIPGMPDGESAALQHAPSAPPWRTGIWPAAQAAAGQSIQNNQIDPAYQDLVRDYFQRP
jgi:hypothetical protein